MALTAATSLLFYNNFMKNRNIDKNVKIVEQKDDTLMNIDVVTNPMVYDYMRGMLGRNFDVNINNYGNIHLLLVNTKDLNSENGSFYESMSTPVDMIPSLNSDPLKYEVSGEKWVGLTETFKTWPKDLVLSMGDYNIYIVKEGDGNHCYSQAQWQGFDFSQSSKRESIYQKESENGFDVSWLRREPWKSEIKANFGIDIDDPFYDKYKYNEIITINHKEDPNDIIRIKVVNVNKFRVLDGMVMDYTFDDLNTQLEYDGFKTLEKR